MTSRAQKLPSQLAQLITSQRKLKEDQPIGQILDGLLKRPKMENNTINDMKRVVARNVKQQFTIIKEEEAMGQQSDTSGQTKAILQRLNGLI
ncbi:hypothetical protein KEM48_011381 [Puccinia striiformis f. sp. tritici PST-130]|nr:hypothetical protein KEM48_011381 [Puccinia striiformis f. sp. tritici PST-130]